MKTGRALLAGLVAVALAQATPFDLHQKPGVKPNQLLVPAVSPCGVYTRPALHRTIIDDVDQPLIAIHEEQSHCIATAVPPSGFFAYDEKQGFDDALHPEDVALLEASGLFGGLLLITAFATKTLRPPRHRGTIVKRRTGRRRSLASI